MTDSTNCCNADSGEPAATVILNAGDYKLLRIKAEAHNMDLGEYVSYLLFKSDNGAPPAEAGAETREKSDPPQI